MGRNRAALGVRCHSGWAAVILLTGSKTGIEILDRRRVELCDPRVEGSKQPFHHAEPMPFARAKAFIARCAKATDALANGAIEALLEAVADMRLRLVGCAVLCASGRALPSLKDILASHALIHAAEGEFYRDAVARTVERTGLSVTRIRERDALLQASDQTGLAEGVLSERLATCGKRLGPPWTEDQKLATLAAWSILASR